MAIKKWQRLLFWLILGILSIFFAEVLSFSEPFMFVQPSTLMWGYPVYGFHMLVLAPLVIRVDRRLRFTAIFTAGGIFGLYEAYMTKVLWAQPWDTEALAIGGVDIGPTAMLVLFWHPFFAFIIPLFVGGGGGADALMLNSGRLFACLPERAQRILHKPWAVPLSAMLSGIFLGANIGGPFEALLASASSSLSIFVLLLIWDWAVGRRRLNMAELLPRGKSWWICLLLLLVSFVFMFFAFNPENLPGLGPQVIIWGMYLFFAALLLRLLRQAPPEDIAAVDVEGCAEFRSPARRWLPFALFFIASTTLSGLLFPWLGETLMILLWFFGFAVGLFALVYTLKQAFSRKV